MNYGKSEILQMINWIIYKEIRWPDVLQSSHLLNVAENYLYFISYILVHLRF